MNNHAAYAAKPEASRGREFAQDRGGKRGPRSEFQRDRDRIIHSMSFRRLRSKTQVFISPEGDHYRTRMTHSLEVAQIGRVIARALGLDEDLTEALCLAHDMGHPPFGHAGESALEEAMVRYGGFDHNAQALRTVMRLDSPYPEHEGLNLSWEVLEGLAKHNGPVQAPNWALAELDAVYPLMLGQYASLEAQVAAIADDIAYDNHDIDDGLRAGFLTVEDLLEVEFLADLWREVEKRHPTASRERMQRELIRDQIGLMVTDVIEHTRSNVAGIASVEDVREAGRQLAGFSADMADAERGVKRFMYERLYYHGEQVAAAEKARDVIARLFAAYSQDSSLMPDEWQANMSQDEPARSRLIADFIAGMTDGFAIKHCEKIYGEAPSGLVHV